MTVGIILKPDSFNSVCYGERANALFKSFGAFLLNKKSYLNDQYAPLENNAITQVIERGRTESSFVGVSRYKDIIGNIFYNKLSKRWNDSKTYTAFDIINKGLLVFPFIIIKKKFITLTSKDVDIIYDLKTNPDYILKKRLHDYLDNKKVCIIILEGNELFLLQQYKTFIRHFLIMNRTESFPLKNLIHVTESDSEYVKTLVEKNIFIKEV